jgi:hypothetical protein
MTALSLAALVLAALAPLAEDGTAATATDADVGLDEPGAAQTRTAVDTVAFATWPELPDATARWLVPAVT